MAAPDGIAFSRDGRNLLISSRPERRLQRLRAAGRRRRAGADQPVDHQRDLRASAISPNDDRVLFTADQGGNELDHVYVRLADGSVRDLTPGENLKAGFIGWSADGRTFYVTTNERDARSLRRLRL